LPAIGPRREADGFFMSDANANLPDPDLLNDWAREAGALALKYYNGATRARISSKPDRSIVTEADKAVEKLLVERIRERFPGHGVIGEEGARLPSDLDAPVWILDPIDGTSLFADQLTGWCVSIGVFRGGRPWLGAVYLPQTDRLYWVDAQGKARLNDDIISATDGRHPDREPTLLLTTHAHHQLDNRWQGRCLILGAVAVDVCLVARGAAAAVATRPHIWDVAAGWAIAQAAGAEIISLPSGAPVDYRLYLEEPSRRPADVMIVCAPEFKEELLASLSRKSDPRRQQRPAASEAASISGKGGSAS
jgi:myo-inositol-1(or 4)-monophosphatase